MADSAAATSLEALGPIQETVATFRSDFTNLERLVDGLFDEIERLSGELEQKAAEAAQQRVQLEAREQELAQQRDEARRLAQQWDEQQTLLTDLRGELAGLKELFSDHLEDIKTHAVQSQTVAAQYQSETASVTSELAEKLGATERERDELERELDVLRGQNAQLAERIAQQQELQENRQGETAAELKRLGTLVEERFGRFAQLAIQAGSAAVAPKAKSAASESTDSCDPIVNSVAAQLSKLQRAVTRAAADDRAAKK